MIYQSELRLEHGGRIMRAGDYTVLLNDHGVIVDGAEHLECPHPRRGWQGCPPVEIRLCQTPAGWAWAVSWMFAAGGCGEPLLPAGIGHDPEPTRDDAIAAAVHRLLSEFAIYLRMHSPCRESRAAVAWLKTLGKDA